MKTYQPTLVSAVNAWCLLDAQGLGTPFVWHVLFADWGLCDCVRCRWNAYCGGDQ